MLLSPLVTSGFARVLVRSPWDGVPYRHFTIKPVKLSRQFIAALQRVPYETPKSDHCTYPHPLRSFALANEDATLGKLSAPRGS